MSVEKQTHIGCLIINLVCGRNSSHIQRETETFLANNGIEWTVSRLKAYWNAAQHLRNGDSQSAVKVYQQNSISYDKRTRVPKGQWGWVIHQFVKADKPSSIRRWSSVLRFYTSLSLPQGEFTPSQKRKALESITNVPEATYNLEQRSKQFENVSRWLIKEQGFKPISVSSDWIHAENIRATSYYYSKVKCPKRLSNIPYAKMTLSLMTNEWVPSSIDKAVPCFELRQEIRESGYTSEFVGRIHPIQEQGCKARVVAQPSAWLQLAFAPLHRILEKEIERRFRKESCVLSQTKGVDQALEHLIQGGNVYCVDLSSATDRFPARLSIALLRELGYPAYADALQDVLKMKWEFPGIPEGVTYGNGQPMGLYGSFPLFHLTNLFVCKILETSLGMRGEPFNRFPNGSTFFVLGDDVIFSDERIAEGYRMWMSDLQVPISEHKCFSGKFGEFAGFILTPTQSSYTAFRPYKVPDTLTITNPLQFLHSIGSKVKKMSPWWEKQFNAYSATLSRRDLALSPLVNDSSVGYSIYRGDNQRMLSIREMLKHLIPSELPVLNPETGDNINTLPLFHERRMFDFYGYNEKNLISQDKERKVFYRTYPSRLLEDPLIRDYHNAAADHSQNDSGPDEDDHDYYEDHEPTPHFEV